MKILSWLTVCLAGLCACQADDDAFEENCSVRFISQVIDAPLYGVGAGFGQDNFPEVVLGPPHGKGSFEGNALDVLSLGKHGSITLGFSMPIADGPGPDLVVFENAFYVGDDSTQPYAELAEVALSVDGVSWHTFPCNAQGLPYEGCAGWHPVYANPDKGISVAHPDAGGDAFDLAVFGMTEASYVQIRDLGWTDTAPTAGFDLDAIAALNQPCLSD